MAKKRIQKKSGKKQAKKIGLIISNDVLNKLQSAEILETPARRKLLEKYGEEELKKIESGLNNLN
jgi:hypothetical protein